MKKKITALLMTLALMVSMCACSKDKKESKKTKKTRETEISEEDPEESSDPDESSSVFSGIDAVKQDLTDLGFTVTDGTDDFPYDSYKDAKHAFCASKGEELYFYGEFDSKAKIQELDDQCIPGMEGGCGRVTFSDIIWHCNTTTKGAFWYLVINPHNYKILYYKGTEDKGSRSNAYAFEMGIIPENSIVMPFADDPDYPEGKGLTKTPSNVPQIDLENQAALDLMETLYRDGNVIEKLPAKGLKLEGETVRSKGFMVLGGVGEYKDVLMLTYMETNTTDPDQAFEEIRGSIEAEGMDFEHRGSLRVGYGGEGSEGILVIFDYETGYQFRVIAASKELAEEMAEKCGFDL